MRSFLNVTMFLALLPTACGGGSDNGPEPDEGEAEAEGEGDDPCPPEGCETDIVCSAERPCPNDDPCRPHRCDTASATCRWNLLDSDGDGFAPIGCDGSDCNDAPERVEKSGLDGPEQHPGAPELCNGYDDDCDGEIDEGISDNAEICNGLDDNCNGEADEGFASACGDSTTACVMGEVVECDCCDGLDNDEDGMSDASDWDCGGVNWCPFLYCAGGRGSCSCLEIYYCAADCAPEDDAWQTGCLNEGCPSAQTSYSELNVCVNAACTTVCGSSGWNLEDEDCLDCAVMNCIMEFVACQNQAC